MVRDFGPRGRFRSLSEALDFAPGFCPDPIRTGHVCDVGMPHRGWRVMRSVRVNWHVLDGMMETWFFDRPEVADFTLEFYRGRLQGECRLTL